jgi:hypothetical protein
MRAPIDNHRIVPVVIFIGRHCQGCGAKGQAGNPRCGAIINALFSCIRINCGAAQNGYR